MRNMIYKNLEIEYEQFRINNLESKDDEFIPSYSEFLRRKRLTKTKRNNLVKIRIKRLITEVQKIPMLPFIWTDDKIEKRTKPDYE